MIGDDSCEKSAFVQFALVIGLTICSEFRFNSRTRFSMDHEDLWGGGWIIWMGLFFIVFDEFHHWWQHVLRTCCCWMDISSHGLYARVGMVSISGDGTSFTSSNQWGVGAHQCDKFDFSSFWCVSTLMTRCSENMLLLYGHFITRIVCACGDGIYIRWWDVAFMTQSMGLSGHHCDKFGFCSFL